MHTIVLADGGGPAELAAVDWLRGTMGATVVTVTVDLGQERDLEAVRDRALAAGAARAHVIDRRAAFAREFLLPALKADADLSTGAWGALVWPALGQTLVDVAVMEGASAVAYAGARFRGSHLRASASAASAATADRSRSGGHAALAGHAPDSRGGAQLETAVRALGPDLMVIAATPDAADVRQDAALPAPRPTAPEEPAWVGVSFARGVPSALNGIDMPLEELLASLETIAGAYAAGRHQEPDDRGTAPVAKLYAMAALRSAHHALRSQVTDGRLGALCDLIGREYAALVLDAQWFSPTRRALDGFADEVQARVTGTVRVRLSADGLEHVAVSSPFARATGARRASAAEGQSIAL